MKGMKAFSIHIAALLAFVNVHAQDSVRVQLPSVEILPSWEQEGLFQPETFNSSWVRNSGVNSAGDALALEHQLPLRIYGPSGSVVSAQSASLSPDHFQVLWRGMPINSVTLGMSDLTSVPTGIFNGSTFSVQQKADFSSLGGASGTLSLRQDQEMGINVQTAFDNLLNLRTNVKARLKLSDRLISDTRVSLSRFQNEFEFEDPLLFQDSLITQRHNDFSQTAVVQSFEYEFNTKWSADASVWLQGEHFEIPEIMGSAGESFAEQFDSLIRISAGVQRVTEFAKHEIRFGQSNANQRYLDKFNADDAWVIDSRTEEKRSFFRYAWIGQFDAIKIVAKYDVIRDRVYSRNLGDGSATRWVHGPQTSVQWSKANAQVETGGRLNIANGVLVPTGSFTTRIRKNNWRAQLLVNRVFRIPDFNELYWNPGGDPNLQSEEGWNYRGVIGFEKAFTRTSLSSSIQVYHNRMDQMIVWLPGYGFWFASNHEDIEVTGCIFELDIVANLNKIKWKHALNSQWQWNPLSSELQQAFFPQWMGSYKQEITWKGFDVAFQGRAIANSLSAKNWNSDTFHQDAIWMLDAFVSRTFAAKNWKVRGSILVQNINNTIDYRIINTARPGRIVGLSLSFNYNQK